MEAEGGVGPARLRCRECGAEAFANVNGRAGESRLQRRWDHDPRSWFDRRKG
jgi:hypothetical protein